MALRARQYSPRTEEAYLGWVRRFLGFHRAVPPEMLAAAHVVEYLSALADRGRVSVSTQEQATAACEFLFRRVLGRPLPRLEGVTPAPRPRRLPTVLTRCEVSAIMHHLTGAKRLVALLLYGSGLRLLEALSLRVKDLDFERCEITVRAGKGDKDRRTVLPSRLHSGLRKQLHSVKQLHERDRAHGHGSVAVPGALARKYPGAARAWGWQWVFPATSHYEELDIDPHRPLIAEMLICRSVDNSLTYLVDLLTLLYATRPEMLRSGEQIGIDVVLRHPDIDSLRRAIAERRIERLSYLGMRDLVKYVKDQHGFDLIPDGSDLERAVLLVEIRNLIVHNRGVVNRVSASKAPLLGGHVGNQVPLLYEEVKAHREFLKRQVTRIDLAAVGKFGLPIFAPAT